jgi:hypothetical protein
MNISKFTVGPPDSDGDFDLDIEVTTQNEGQYDVRFIKTSVLLLNTDGVGFTSSIDNEHEIRMRSGEGSTLDPSGWLHANKMLVGGSDPSNITAEVYLTQYRRDYLKLGTIDCPVDHLTPVTLKKEVTMGGTAQVLSAIISRTKPDEDNDVRLEICCCLRSVGDEGLEKVVLKASLLDEEDAVIEDSEASAEINRGGAGSLEPSFYTNASNLQSARIRLALAVYTSVERFSATAQGSPPEED